MSRDSSLDNNPMEDSQDSQETREVFKDIRKYFSEEEWAKLGNSEKRTCVSMKRNYEIMTRLGFMINCPDFMRPKNCTTKSPEHDSDEDQNPGNQVLELLGSREEETNAWLGRLRERKNHIVYEEISDPEEDD
uniref:SSX family member 5 n=1 Tax=Pipistrellus kuhlii TaxID=59472 RepID=A0A7J7T1Y0_PIPKU|nr:SSX family member 5 [Pipistrellus kuhlii]